MGDLPLRYTYSSHQSDTYVWTHTHTHTDSAGDCDHDGSTSKRLTNCCTLNVHISVQVLTFVWFEMLLNLNYFRLKLILLTNLNTQNKLAHKNTHIICCPPRLEYQIFLQSRTDASLKLFHKTFHASVLFIIQQRTY